MKQRNHSRTMARSAARRWVGVAAVGLLMTVLAGPRLAIAADGQDAAPDAAESAMSVEELRAEVRRLADQLARLDEERGEAIRRLQRRIEELEQQLELAEGPGAQDELEQLLTEAERETTEEARKEQAAEAERETFVGRQRSLQALNPEISFLGDVSYDWADSDVRDQFLIRGVEISFQAPLDPYTRFKGFLVGHQEAPELAETPGPQAPAEEEHAGEIGVEVEEAYMEWVALPAHTRLRVGKFRQQFGTLNRWHPHALPSADVPFALRNIYGDEGLVGLGVGLDWQLPGLWATSNALTLEVVNADNDSAFAGSEFTDPTYLLRHSGFYDLGPDTYFELGLSGVIGPNDDTGVLDTTVAGLDFNFVWEPVQFARYSGMELRGEYLVTDFETGGGSFESSSLYTYLSWKLGRRWSIGWRYDDAELPTPRVELLQGQPVSEGLRERGLTSYLTFWQSEFVRLRVQYQHVQRDFAWAHGPDDDDRLWLQVTFAAGPHKHEAY